MPLHPNFPESPYAVIDPAIRWFPADEALRETTMVKLMPPLVAQLRKMVQDFRTCGYVGASETNKGLLNWWFNTPHLLPADEGTMAEGVILERKPMGEGTGPKTPLVIEIDNDNIKKDLDALDIEIPVLTPRVYREYKTVGVSESDCQHLKTAVLVRIIGRNMCSSGDSKAER